MAIVKYGALIASASGSIGSTTFASGKSTQVARIKRQKKKPAISQQSNQQLVMAQAKIIWQQLTNNQRLQWQTLSRNITFPNRLGQQRTLTPFQVFFKSYSWFPTSDPTQIKTPSYKVKCPMIESITTTAVGGAAGTVTIVHSAPGAAGTMLMAIWFARSYRRYPIRTLRGWRRIANSGPSGTTIIGMATIRQYFGDLQPGEYYGVRCIIFPTNADIEVLAGGPATAFGTAT